MSTLRMSSLVVATGALLLSASARASGQCSKERDANPATTTPMPGAFVPQCTKEGNYVLVQHHGSTGYSWCVNPSTGSKVEGTEIPPGKGTPTCPACLEQLASTLEKSSGEQPVVGMYTPQCAEDGTYKKVQHHASTGMTWCANPQTGKKLTPPARSKGPLTCP